METNKTIDGEATVETTNVKKENFFKKHAKKLYATGGIILAAAVVGGAYAIMNRNGVQPEVGGMTSGVQPDVGDITSMDVPPTE